MEEKIRSPHFFIPRSQALELEDFRQMDYYAVENYALPIELMMENAGLNLARLVAMRAKKEDLILIGVGNGNNGGGGLVAARRLAAWGYDVYLDLATEISRDLPKTQLERALKFGAKEKTIDNPSIWVDAYLGFSQKLPLRDEFLTRVTSEPRTSAFKLSLDLPTGYTGDLAFPYFKAHQVLTLAYPKTILYDLPETEIFIADLGIPKEVYEKFGVVVPPFQVSSLLRLSLE